MIIAKAMVLVILVLFLYAQCIAKGAVLMDNAQGLMSALVSLGIKETFVSKVSMNRSKVPPQQ